jgi:hypothetical protein
MNGVRAKVVEGCLLDELEKLAGGKGNENIEKLLVLKHETQDCLMI